MQPITGTAWQPGSGLGREMLEENGETASEAWRTLIARKK